MDQIEANYPGQVAPIEWHTSSSYPLHCPEARQRWYTYPPPYWYNNGWYYATPWAWIDGKNRGYQSGSWDYWVQQRLGEPAEVGIGLAGAYTPGAGSGELVVELVNETSSPITANLYVVITEDSLYYSAPNGDVWHNHVCRDYVTGTSGTSVTIPATGADTVVQSFTIESGWVEQNCHVIAFLQNPTQQADSSRPIYQGGTIPLLSLTGVSEGRPVPRPAPTATVGPNPVGDRAELRFAVAPGTGWTWTAYSADGRLVAERRGTGPARLDWNRTDDQGRRLSAGVYAWRLVAGTQAVPGKLVLAD